MKLAWHAIGIGVTEFIHIGQAVLGLGGGLDYFLPTVFNYPTLAECYKVAALNADNKFARSRGGTTCLLAGLWRRRYCAASVAHSPVRGIDADLVL